MEPLLRGDPCIPKLIKLIGFALCVPGTLQSDGIDCNHSEGGDKTPVYSGHRCRVQTK